MEQTLALPCFGFHPARAGEMPAMKDVAADYLVTASEAKWKLILEYGARSYEVMGEAIEAAVEAAHAAGKSGCPQEFCFKQQTARGDPSGPTA
jgi:hypothetical protein